MKNKNLISINDFSKEEYLRILKTAEGFEANPVQPLLNDYVIALLFFEASTRTRLSFESAANRLGARTIGFTDASSSSVTKGESLKDTIKMVNSYADLIVMRHHLEGSARYAGEVSSVPVINAGDGANQHPTQCLLDLYSIQKTQGTLDDLDIVFVGDLKFGRTVHSLTIALSNFNIKFHFVSPVELKLPSSVKKHLKNKNIPFDQYTNLNEVLPKADILYMTRIQRERFSDPIDYENVKNAYILDASMLANVKDNMKILHPLPRVNEIAENVDETKHAYYFQQAKNGVYVRQALLTSILGLT